MATVRKFDRIPIDIYLKDEQRSHVRHEYVNGVTYARVGSTARHNQVAIALTTLLHQHLKGKPCTVFMSDMKVRVDEVFYYPDVMVVCDAIKPTSLYQTTPALLVEVLSQSTEAKDRLEKLVAYQSLPSLTEYVLLAQDKVYADIYRRHQHTWQLENISHSDTINLTSIQHNFPIEACYEQAIQSMQ